MDNGVVRVRNKELAGAQAALRECGNTRIPMAVALRMVSVQRLIKDRIADVNEINGSLVERYGAPRPAPDQGPHPRRHPHHRPPRRALRRTGGRRRDGDPGELWDARLVRVCGRVQRSDERGAGGPRALRSLPGRRQSRLEQRRRERHLAHAEHESGHGRPSSHRDRRRRGARAV